MPEVDEYLQQLKGAVEYVGVGQKTLKHRGAAGNITVCQHPVNNGRLFNASDPGNVLMAAEQASPHRAVRIGDDN